MVGDPEALFVQLPSPLVLAAPGGQQPGLEERSPTQGQIALATTKNLLEQLATLAQASRRRPKERQRQCEVQGFVGAAAAEPPPRGILGQRQESLGFGGVQA